MIHMKKESIDRDKKITVSIPVRVQIQLLQLFRVAIRNYRALAQTHECKRQNLQDACDFVEFFKRCIKNDKTDFEFGLSRTLDLCHAISQALSVKPRPNDYPREAFLSGEFLLDTLQVKRELVLRGK